MIRHGITAARLEQLITEALAPEQLHEFFRAHRKPLLLAGHPSQDVPPNFVEAVNAIVALPAKADRIFANWLAKQPKNYPDTLAEQLVARFRAIEDEGLEPAESELRQLFRCGLDELYGESPREDWISFLREAEDAPDDLESAESTNNSAVSVVASAEALEAFVKVLRGDAPVSSIEDPQFRVAAALVEAAKHGDPAVITRLGLEGNDYASLRALLEMPSANTDEQARRGLRATAPIVEAWDPECDYVQFEVIATCRRTVSSRHSFLDIEGFAGNTGVFTLSRAGLRRAVPDEGRLILYPDSPVHEPALGVPVAYRVEHLDTPKSIKARVVGPGQPLVRVVYVPYASRDYDLVRTSIETSAQDKSVTSALFVTTDGLCLKPRAEPLQRVTSASYDWILDAYSEVTATEFAAGPYVVGPLSTPSKPYDCAPLVVSARRVFKALADRKAIGVTRAEIAEIVEQLKGDTDLTEARRSRIVDKLETLAEKDADYDAFITEVMKAPMVREDIERRKKEEAANADGEIAGKKKTLDRLRQEETRLEKSLQELQNEADKRVKAIRAEIRKVFERAKAKEAETLGNLALWEVLGASGSSAPVATSELVRQTSEPFTLTSTLSAPRHETTADVFRSIGFSDGDCTQYGGALDIARKLGMPLLVSGLGAASVGRRLAHFGTCSTLCVEVPIGVISPQPLAQLLANHPDAALLLINGNLSDLSCYGPMLLEEIVEGVLKADGYEGARRIVLTGATGPAALPWPVELERLAVKLNLSAPISTDSLTDAGLMSSAEASPLQKKLWLRLENEESKGGTTAIGARLLKHLTR